MLNTVDGMRLALQALFSCAHDLSEDGVRQRAKIENELRNNPRSAEFYRKLELSVSDPRLGAPEIFGVESFPDSNIVAEYLDANLDSLELCDEYEKLCSEHPEALAEVGDCYDVLNNRLCHAAKTPQSCRRRLYHIAREEERSEQLPVDVAPDEQRANDQKNNDFGRLALESHDDSKDKTSSQAEASVAPSRKKRARRSVVGFGKKTASFGAKSLLALLVTIGGLRLLAATRARFQQDVMPPSEMATAEQNDGNFNENETVSSSGFLSVPKEDSNSTIKRVPTEPPMLAREFDAPQTSVSDTVPLQRWGDVEDVRENGTERITEGDELRGAMTIPFQSNNVFGGDEEMEAE